MFYFDIVAHCQLALHYNMARYTLFFFFTARTRQVCDRAMLGLLIVIIIIYITTISALYFPPDCPSLCLAWECRGQANMDVR